MANEKVDVVIVGAGASGSVFAAVLAKAGKKVVILEQGPDWQLTDLISSDFWGRRIKPASGPFLLEGKNPFGYVYQAGWGVGGAALHYFANFPRLLPNDFKIKSEHGRAHDWPISYQDVAPYYDKVAQDVGVSGDAKAEEIWRPAGAPYPMPPMKTFRHGDVWLKACEAAGIRLVPAAVGMNSTDYKGRPACIYDGWCHVGCPTGALSNPLVTYLGDAKKAGAEVRAQSTVTRVLCNAQGNKVTGVEYYDAKKERQVQEASVVVLAAWSAQNPRLLFNSATDKHPKGLANSSGLLGKYMMAHFSSGTWAMFDEPERRLRQLVHRRGLRAQDERSRRLCQCPPRSIRARPRRLHETRRARIDPHRGVRRGIAEHREPHRARERQGRVWHAAREDHP